MRLITLNDVAQVIDCEHKTAPTRDSGYPSIRTPNVGRGRLILESVRCVSEETYKQWTQRAVPKPGDLILAREAPVGNVAIILPGQPVCLGQRTVLIRVNSPQIIPAYLVYLLLGDEVQGRFQSLSTGATVGHLNVRDIRELPLPQIPPLPTQRKIAAILSAYDDLIENNTRRIKILEEMAQNLYREWFVKFRFPGHEHARFVDSPLGRIPEGWEVKKLSEIAKVNKSQIKKNSAPEIIHYIDISSVSQDQINIISTHPFSEAPGRARRIVQHGDIIWSCVRPNRRSHARVIHPQSNTVVSTGFAVLSALTVPFIFLYYSVTTDDFVGYLTNNATGAAYPAVNSGTFEKAELIIPPSDLLERFNEITQVIIEHIHILQCQVNILRTTRDLLLPKLISGVVDVSDINITVPVEVEA